MLRTEKELISYPGWLCLFCIETVALLLTTKKRHYKAKHLKTLQLRKTPLCSFFSVPCQRPLWLQKHGLFTIYKKFPQNRRLESKWDATFFFSSQNFQGQLLQIKDNPVFRTECFKRFWIHVPFLHSHISLLDTSYSFLWSFFGKWNWFLQMVNGFWDEIYQTWWILLTICPNHYMMLNNHDSALREGRKALHAINDIEKTADSHLYMYTSQSYHRKILMSLLNLRDIHECK